MKKLLILGIAMGCIFHYGSAQDTTLVPGMLAIGFRTTLNHFPNNKSLGIGAGCQFKLAFNQKVNTEWFIDQINSNAGENGFRRDYHIGWSAQFAPFGKGFGTNKISPFLLGGQCFDLTRVGAQSVDPSPLVFSVAAQVGLGLAWFPTEKFEINMQTQYMVHLGNHTHLEYDDHGDVEHYHTVEETNFAGHFLMTISANYYFLKLWKKRA